MHFMERYDNERCVLKFYFILFCCYIAGMIVFYIHIGENVGIPLICIPLIFVAFMICFVYRYGGVGMPSDEQINTVRYEALNNV